MNSEAGILIRRAKTRDLPELLEILAQLSQATPLDSDSTTVRDVWQETQAQPLRELLVAEVGGQIVGTVDWYLTPNLTHDARPYITIENFVVDSSNRRKGVGRALLNSVITEAQRAGCYKIQLQSDIKRADAHRLYEAVGFKPSAQGYRLYL
jgi:GNAT superfamily N-acetyltransferase